MKKSIVTNKVSFMGRISSEFQFSHNTDGICYYVAEIDVARTSGCTDHIPVIVSENILKLPEENSDVCIKGQFRSRNQSVDGKKGWH